MSRFCAQYDVCMMTSYHSIDDDRIYQKEIHSLVKNGYRVIFLAPNEVKNVSIENIRIIGFKMRKGLGRLLTMGQMTYVALRIQAHIYHFHEPELLLTAFILRLLIPCKLIYDIHEEYSTSATANIKKSLIKNIIGWIIYTLEWMLCHIPDYLIVVRDDLEKRFRGYGCSNISQVLVCAQLSLFPIRKKNLSEFIKPVIVHEGNLDIKSRGLDKFLHAAKIVLTRYPMAEFVIIGRAPNEDVVWMKKFIEDNQIQANIGFTGWINFKQIPQFLENANIGILLLQPVSLNNFMGLPNKLFDYMAAGIPTVACHFPNISKIVNETNCGILVDPTDVEAIARAIIYLIENPDEAEIMGHNGRNAFERKYNWEMMERRLLDIYSKLLKAG